MAGAKLREAILRLADACDCASVAFEDGCVTVTEDKANGDGKRRTIPLREQPLDGHGYVITAEATFDPPTSPLDENGQGIPYAVFGFGAHLAEFAVIRTGHRACIENNRRA